MDINHKAKGYDGHLPFLQQFSFASKKALIAEQTALCLIIGGKDALLKSGMMRQCHSGKEKGENYVFRYRKESFFCFAADNYYFSMYFCLG